MAAIQHEYELSIWRDVWARPTLLDENGNAVYTCDGEDVLDEEKSAILSMDNFTFPGKAINIIFKTKINGTHELTFDLPGKYIDPSTGKKVKNYLVKLIDNEVKVKLYRKNKNKWFSFYVKKVTEKREKNYMTYSYTCTDSFINELSKTGYKLTFNEYSEHYIEQIHPFAEDILKNSEWSYNEQLTKQSCDLVEYQEEKTVIYTVPSGTTLYKLNVDNDNYQYSYYGTDSQVVVSNDGNPVTLYGFYSEFGQDVVDIYGHATGTAGHLIKQVVYVPNNNYEISGNTIVNKNCYYVLDVTATSSITGLTELNLGDHRYGMKVCYNPYSEYCKELDRYVKRYDNTSSGPQEIFSYTKSRVMVPNIAVNYAANSKEMTDTTGWAPQYAVDKLKVGKTATGTWNLDPSGVPVIDPTQKVPNTYSIIAENLTTDSNVTRIINTGPYSRGLTIDTPTTFALRIDYSWKQYQSTVWTTASNGKVYAIGEDYTTDAITTHRVTVKICQPIVSGISGSYYNDIITEASAMDSDGNYNLTFSNPLYTISGSSSTGIVNGQYYLIKITNDMLVSHGGKLENLFIVIEAAGSTSMTSALCISDLEFFEAWTYDGRHTRGANGSLVIDTLRSPSDIVPSYATGTTPSAGIDVPNNAGTDYSWMQTYIDSLNSGTASIQSASLAYSTMQSQLNNWTNAHPNTGTDDAQYSLVTETSIVSGKAFDEEMYFYVPEDQPQFGDPVVYYINPDNDNDYNLVKWYTHNKYRTLKQEKSNRFNLTQQLSELFHVYPVYEIEYYKNGKVKKSLYTENNEEITLVGDQPSTTAPVAYSKRHKYLYYTDTKGGENKYGFKYGHNLSSVSRTIDSTDIVTKMFVTDNLNQYAKDGICTIARAIDNLGKDTYLLRFDYFVNKGLVDKERIDNDLYGTTERRTYTFNEFISDTNDNPYREGLSNYESYTSSDIPNVTIYQGFLKTIGEINSRYDEVTEEQTLLEKHQLIVLEASVQTYTSALKALREQLAKQKNLAAAYEGEEANKKWAEYVESCERISSKIQNYEVYLLSAQYLYEMYADLYNKYECEMHFLLYCKNKAEVYFNTRYESLLREGVWQDSKYLDDNSYYLDAEKVLVDSCGPKITYTISVIDLSVLKKYHFADFNVGDVTYVQDYEFFNENEEGTDKFYEERTIVSAITCNLDDPSKNTISLQNYSTKFDDLFSRVTASVQSLTFNENIYQRAARFTPNGQVDEETLQNTLDNDDLTLVGNQDVVIDGNGVLVTDLRIPSNKVKIVGSGVYLTGNGGASWYGAFENGGINASLLTVGAINTQSITIMNNNYTNFFWDANGITAYKTAYNSQARRDTVSGAQYVRFNQYGLYFVNETSGAATFDLTLTQYENGEHNYKKEDISKFIRGNAAVAITYDGFSINGAENKVRFTSEDGIEMYNNDNEKVVQLGFIKGLSGNIDDFWGLYAQGAYIEGKLYSERIYTRSINIGGETGQNTVVLDHSRSILQGGQLQIWRTIKERQAVEQGETDTEVKRITTFGSALLKVTQPGSDDTSESDNGETEQIPIEEYLSNLGSSVHIDNDGRFWSVAAYDEAKDKYITKIIYARKDLGPYLANTFNVQCTLKAKELVNTSDRRLKRDIADIDNRYLDMFDKLVPKLYNFKSEEENVARHIGLIAQEVQEARKEAGLTYHDMGAVSSEDSEVYASVNYTELLTLAIAKIKILEKRIDELENKKALEN